MTGNVNSLSVYVACNTQYKSKIVPSSIFNDSNGQNDELSFEYIIIIFQWFFGTLERWNIDVFSSLFVTSNEMNFDNVTILSSNPLFVALFTFLFRWCKYIEDDISNTFLFYQIKWWKAFQVFYILSHWHEMWIVSHFMPHLHRYFNVNRLHKFHLHQSPKKHFTLAFGVCEFVVSCTFWLFKLLDTHKHPDTNTHTLMPSHRS